MTDKNTLYEYWQALYERKRTILIVTLSSAGFAFVISLLLPSVYEAKSMFYMPLATSTPLYTVSGSPSQVDRAPLMPVAEENAAGMHVGILEGGDITTRVLEEFPNKTRKELEKSVDFVLSEYFMTEVYVRDEDPEMAAAIANYYPMAYLDFHRRSVAQRSELNVVSLEKQIGTTEKLLDENLDAQQKQRNISAATSVTLETLEIEHRRLSDLLGTLRENLIEARLEAENPGVELVMTERARVPEESTFPRPVLNTFVALLFGLIMGCYYALLLEYLSRLPRFRVLRNMDTTPLDEKRTSGVSRS